VVELLHAKPFTVRYYEVGPRRLVRPATLLDYLQDAAAEHATLLSIGVQLLHHRDLTWVLSRLRLTVERYAGVGETVLVRTWPSTRGNLSSNREFEVLDQAGEIVARATTAWVVLDMVRRRPVRLAEVLSDYPLESRRAIDDDFPPLQRPGSSGREVAFTVRQSDLDMNRHVNNAVYVGWALESAPEEIAENHGPVDLEVAYRAEALAGDTVAARCVPEAGAGSGRFLHEIIRQQDGRELARLRVRWA
jgi:acyl-ACP thioesterase